MDFFSSAVFFFPFLCSSIMSNLPWSGALEYSRVCWASTAKQRGTTSGGNVWASVCVCVRVCDTHWCSSKQTFHPQSLQWAEKLWRLPPDSGCKVRGSIQSQLSRGGTTGQVIVPFVQFTELFNKHLVFQPWNDMSSHRIGIKKDSSKISRSTSSTCTFSVATDDVHQVSLACMQTIHPKGKLLTQPLSTHLAGHGCRGSKCSASLSQSHRFVSCFRIFSFYVLQTFRMLMNSAFPPYIRAEEQKRSKA